MAEETKYTQHFKEAYRNGFKPKALSRSKWLYDCTQAAIRDLDDVGDFRKTSGGALFYLLQRPSTHVVPLIKDSIQLRTVIERRFGITPGTFPQLYRAIDEACEREAFKRGKPVNVYQFAHADLDTKTLYVALDESRMLKIDDKDVKVVANGTDQIFFEPPITGNRGTSLTTTSRKAPQKGYSWIPSILQRMRHSRLRNRHSCSRCRS